MNKTVVITGASRGIGSQTAIDFALKGYNTVINYNKSEANATQLLRRIRELGHSAIAVKADISIKSQADILIQKTLEEFGNIDVLVNNAGISDQKLFTDITDLDWRNMFSVNIDGLFYCTRSAVKNMISRHMGKIINVSSIWGIVGASCEVHYSASKAAVIGFTKALAKELGPSGIQVNCVAPGVIDTGMNDNLSSTDIKELIDKTPICRMGSCSDISNTILFLAEDESNFITGQVISPNGGFVI